MTILAVQPIYGWGWWTRTGQAFDVPEPFELDASVLLGHAGAWVGLCRSDGRHPLSGLWIALSPRVNQEMNLLALRERPVDTGVFDRVEVESAVVGYADVRDLMVLTKRE